MVLINDTAPQVMSFKCKVYLNCVKYKISKQYHIECVLEFSQTILENTLLNKKRFTDMGKVDSLSSVQVGFLAELSRH